MLYLPLYVYLFISWGLLVITMLTALFVRWSSITYVFWGQQKNYYKAKKTEAEKELSFLQSYPNIAFPIGKDKDTETPVYNENIKIYSEVLIPKTEGYEKNYLIINQILRYSAVISFIAGILLLLYFTASTVYLLIS